MIPRTLAKTISGSLKPGFIAIIYGPRRVGKTVLLNQLFESLPLEKLFLNGDTQETRDLLNTTAETSLTQVVKGYQTIVIDEVQRIPNIALALKIIIDKFPEKTILVSGSTSLKLARGIPEELTGRTLKFRLYPLSTVEMTGGHPNFEKPYYLEEQLVCGGYPYLQHLATPQEKKQYLASIVEDYLFRDILELREVVASDNLRKLATLLAFQIGSQVSLNELANTLKIDVKTVSRYLYLLEQGFIIFELGAFSRNLRKEVVKSKKYYFWDLGIRNALLGLFSPLAARGDIGALWENFLAVERLKKHEYERQLVQTYFWRTYEKAEIDWIEMKGGTIEAYEFKWQPKTGHTPKAFRENYGVETKSISKDNYLDFIGG